MDCIVVQQQMTKGVYAIIVLFTAFHWLLLENVSVYLK